MAVSKKKIILKIILLALLAAPFLTDELKNVNLQASVMRKVKRVLVSMVEIPAPTASISVPFFKQEHSLSCEAASLKMVLRYRGKKVSEKEIMDKVGFDKTEKQEGIWGDPEKAFVGNIDGKMMITGYGVHYQPIARVAKLYRRATGFENWNETDLVREILNKNPVIIWGYIGGGKPYSWKTTEGKEIKTVYAEHTKIVIGFAGPKENPDGFFLLDPIYGKVYLKKDKFLREWDALGRSGVVVY